MIDFLGSQFHTSHTTLTMLPGEYILHEYVGVSSVVSLFIYGSRSEVNRSARENQVVINCEYRGGGIGFTAVANLFLSRITMVKCGIQGVHRGTIGHFQFLYFALHIFAGFRSHSTHHCPFSHTWLPKPIMSHVVTVSGKLLTVLHLSHHCLYAEWWILPPWTCLCV